MGKSKKKVERSRGRGVERSRGQEVKKSRGQKVKRSKGDVCCDLKPVFYGLSVFFKKQYIYYLTSHYIVSPKTGFELQQNQSKVSKTDQLWLLPLLKDLIGSRNRESFDSLRDGLFYNLLKVHILVFWDINKFLLKRRLFIIIAYINCLMTNF